MGYIGDKKREYGRLWVRARRQKWIAENGPCRHCGSNERLEVDHIDRSQKKIPISMIWSRREDIRMSELSKCQVLCYDCHKVKTGNEMRVKDYHGTRYGYHGYKCRCDMCVKAASEYRNAQRRRSGRRS